MKKAIKSSFIVLIILFTITYLNKENNYKREDYIISEESIVKFEKDLKEGKEIIPSNYITPRKDYNNKISKIGLKISNTIEKGVNIVLKRILDSITS